MQRAPDVSIQMAVVPDASRQNSDKQLLQSFNVPAIDFSDIPVAIQSLDKVLGLIDNCKGIRRDKLRITVAGPTLPTRTLVDLPGLFGAENHVNYVDNSFVENHVCSREEVGCRYFVDKTIESILTRTSPVSIPWC